MAAFDKDAWIVRALKAKAIVAREDGTIWRPRRCKNGTIQLTQVKVSTHAKSGRVYFNLTFAGITKSVLVNRVVALRFHPNPLNLPEVNHIDGVKSNNAKANLEWSTGADNEKHAHRTGLKSTRGSSNPNAKLTAAAVISIRESEASDAALAIQYAVSPRTISAIRAGRTWKHV